MKLPEHEREAHRQAFRAMSLSKKLEYILAYYKLPIVLVLIALVAVGSVLHRMLTEKEPVLYVAYANVAVEDDLDKALTVDYLATKGLDSRSQAVFTYPDLYLSDAETSSDHQYSYASRLKLLAAIDAEQLDVVLMSKESYDLLSHSGLLMDLSQVDGLSSQLEGLISSNEVILEDNSLEVQLSEADTYEAVTELVSNSLNLSSLPAFSGLSGDIYLGIIANTPRIGTTLEYVDYLCTIERPSPIA